MAEYGNRAFTGKPNSDAAMHIKAEDGRPWCRVRASVPLFAKNEDEFLRSHVRCSFCERKLKYADHDKR